MTFSMLGEDSTTQPWRLFIAIGLCYIIYYVASTTWDVFYGPLSKFPGPKINAASSLPLVRTIWFGNEHTTKLRLHSKYGPVVRIAPKHLSYDTSQAWQDIYGLARKGKVQLRKDLNFYQAPANGVRDLFDTCDEDYHRYIRKLLSPAFSDKALRDQEPLLKQWAERMVSKLKEKVKEQEAINLVDYFNFTTTDLMADLTFSEDLNMLKSSEYHPWFELTFGYTIQLVRCAALEMIPGLGVLVRFLVGQLSAKTMREHFRFSADRVDRRLQINPSKPDFWTYATREDKGLSVDELHSNSQIFMIAGTETSATLISGTVYQLLKHPDQLQKVTTEVRDAFKSIGDINLATLSSLPYLNACMEEAFRIYPPVPAGMPRVTPENGAEIDGRWVPGGASISVSQYAANHSRSNFTSPEEFLPERWLPGNKEFEHDDKAALQPFSVGPRDCIGRNLAYHESRLILCALLWNFDCELDERSYGWMDHQKSFRLWMKPPLWTKLSVRSDVD